MSTHDFYNQKKDVPFEQAVSLVKIVILLLSLISAPLPFFKCFSDMHSWM